MIRRVARRLIPEWDAVGGWLVALAVAIFIAALALALVGCTPLRWPG